MTRVMTVLALLALTAALWSGWRTRCLLLRLNQMLDKALEGAFREEEYNENLLSAAETKLAHYLTATQTSSQRIQEEKDAIKTLIADISHQTKTPVANVLLYAQLLEEQHPGEYTAALSGQARKLQSLIDALVKTSRLETGILVLRPRPGSLSPVLEEAAVQFFPLAAAKGLTLTVEPTEAEAVFDSRWTIEALCNLVENAVKYTTSGHVKVEVREYGLFVRIDVTDTGPGVPEAEQAKIFQRFYRGQQTQDAAGVGVGLYLVRQIAEGQGGFVKVFSKPGQGTRFSLFLPRG